LYFEGRNPGVYGVVPPELVTAAGLELAAVPSKPTKPSLPSILRGSSARSPEESLKSSLVILASDSSSEEDDNLYSEWR